MDVIDAKLTGDGVATQITNAHFVDDAHFAEVAGEKRVEIGQGADGDNSRRVDEKDRVLPAAADWKKKCRGKIPRRARTGILFESESNRKIDIALILEVHLDGGDIRCDVIAEPLIAVEHGETASRPAATVRGHLHKIVIPARGAAAFVADAGHAAVTPALQRAVFEIIPLTDHNRSRRASESEYPERKYGDEAETARELHEALILG